MYLQIFSKFLILIIVLNYAYAKMYNDDLLDYIITNKTVFNIFNVFIIIIASFYLFNRDFFLPFLGPTVMPIPRINIIRHKDKLINVGLTGLPPNTNVIYWASDESKAHFEDPIIAYKEYANSGIAKTNENGNVVVQVVCPGRYYVPKFGIGKKLLPSHIHYRYELPYKGMYSRVYTKNTETC